MPDTNTQNQDDDLIYFFKNFETILGTPARRDVTNLSTGIDFRVFSNYFIADIRNIRQKLDGADDEYLLYVCEHIYNITEWIHLMVGSISQIFSDAWEIAFDENFGDKYVLKTIYDTSLEKWITGKSGQHKLGGNIYSILDGRIYYRNRFGAWFLVDKETAFDLQPNKELIDDEVIIEQLEIGHKDTWYDTIMDEWASKDYQGVLPYDFMKFDKEITNPEEYFEFTLKHIKWLLDNPVSISELERWNGEKIDNLEDTVKLVSKALEVVKERRKDDSHTVYLLRDCLTFYEMHKTLDLINAEETSSDQLLIGRKLLSQKPDKWDFYIVLLDALYEAHMRYPNNFGDFYNELARLLDIFVDVSSKFRAVVENAAVYIKKHIQTNKNKVVVFDTGFQASINLFVKYVIDRHINPATENKLDTDIEVSVGALWSKELFDGRAKSYYFPFLNRIQYMARSDELYHYVFGSLKEGEVEVTMGNKEWQQKAAAELVALVMIAQLDAQKQD